MATDDVSQPHTHRTPEVQAMWDADHARKLAAKSGGHYTVDGLNEWTQRPSASTAVIVLLLISSITSVVHHWITPMPYLFTLGACALAASTAVAFATRAPRLVKIALVVFLVVKLLALGTVLSQLAA